MFVSDEPSVFASGGVQLSVAEPVVGAGAGAGVGVGAGAGAGAGAGVGVGAGAGAGAGVGVGVGVGAGAGAGAGVGVGVGVGAGAGAGAGAGVGVGVGVGAGAGVGVGVGAGAGVPTVIEKGARRAVEIPSLTAMTMFLYVPTLFCRGQPYNTPLLLLNHVHEGEFSTVKRNRRPLVVLAFGVNI